MFSSGDPRTNRSIDAVGLDFRIEPEGDLVVSLSGDLQPIGGADLITQALIRRIYTPTNGYARWVRTPTGLKQIDTEYANDAFNLLSAVATATNTQKILQAVRKVIESDKRVILNSINLIPTNQRNQVDIQAYYLIKGEAQLRALNLVLSSSGKSIGL